MDEAWSSPPHDDWVQGSPGVPVLGPQLGGTGAPKPTHHSWDSPCLPSSSRCFLVIPRRAQGTDSAQGTGVGGSSCKQCDASTGPTAVWDMICSRERSHLPPSLCTPMPCSLSCPRFTLLFQASER